MQKSIVKLLWSKNNKTSIILSSLGLLMGFLIVLMAINIYLAVKNTIKSDETLFSNDYIVINKKVSLLNTIKFANSDFRKDEIDDLKNQKFVTNLSPFVSNTFKIGAYTEANENIPGFYTELFFQSIPDKYLNIKDKRWKWEEGGKEIPIIFPGDYLRLYNFGFAKSQGLPQVSAETIGKVSFKVKVQGNGKISVFSARIIGLTDKVNSILVPQDFMDWANKIYGNPEEASKTSMILIETDNPANPEIFKYLKKHGLETNSERLKNSKSSMFIKLLFSITIGVGVIITLLSLLLFVLSFDLIVVKSSAEIKKLFYAGYHFRDVLKYYAVILGLIIIGLNIITLSLLYYSDGWLYEYFKSGGFFIKESAFSLDIIIAFFMSLIIFLINIISIRFQLRNLLFKD